MRVKIIQVVVNTILTKYNIMYRVSGVKKIKNPIAIVI